MDRISKYIKKPPKALMIAYGTGAGILLVLFLVLYFTVGRTMTQFVSDTESFKAWLESYKGLSAVVFLIIRSLQTVVKIIPSEPLEIASGYVFGTWGGLFYCSLGTFLGSLIIVMLSRWLGVKFVKTFINEEQIKQLSILSNGKNQKIFLIVFYLIPGTPKDLFTYVVGSLNINLTEFFIITTICRIPSIITSTVCGSQIEKNNIPLAAAVFIATAVISAVCAYVYKKYTDRQKGQVA